jgi:hypothetical protein
MGKLMGIEFVEIDVVTGQKTVKILTSDEEAAYLASIALSVRFPDWDNLYARVLIGDLKPILLNLKAIAKTDNAIAISFFSLTTVLSQLRTEQALRDCLDELIADGYVLSDEHRSLWNNAIAELNFSDLVKL